MARARAGETAPVDPTPFKSSHVNSRRFNRVCVGASLLAAGLLAIAGLLAGWVLVSGAAAGKRPAPQHQLIPLYDEANAGEWAQACSQANGSGDGSWIVANAAAEGGGPGGARKPAWVSVIESCHRHRRVSVIGYVWTDYGRASIASVEGQIDAWNAYYPGEIAGIFFDGVSDEQPATDSSNQGYYRALASYVHTHESSDDEVVFNFGRNPVSGWMLDGDDSGNADIVVTFEGSYDTPGENPYTSWTQAAWELGYPANDFAALIHDAPGGPAAPQPASACASLAKQNIGYVYVGTSYEELPSYFNDLSRESRNGGC